MDLPDKSSPPKSVATPLQHSGEDASLVTAKMLPEHGDVSFVADQRSISSTETAPLIPSPVVPQSPAQISTLSSGQGAFLPITTSKTTSKGVSSASTSKTIVPLILQLTSPSGRTVVLSEVTLPTGKFSAQECVSSVSPSKTVVPPVLEVTSPSGRTTVLFSEVERNVAESESAPCISVPPNSVRSVPSTVATSESENIEQSPASSTQHGAPSLPPEFGPFSLSPSQLRQPEESPTHNKACAHAGEGSCLVGLAFEDISPAQSSFSSPKKSLAEYAIHSTVEVQEANRETQTSSQHFFDDPQQPWVPFLLLQTVTPSAILLANNNSSELHTTETAEKFARPVQSLAHVTQTEMVEAVETVETGTRTRIFCDNSPPTCLPPPLQPHSAGPFNNSNRLVFLPIANTSASVVPECRRTTLTETSETETKTEIHFDDSPPFWLPQPLLPRTSTQFTTLPGSSIGAGIRSTPNASVSVPLASFHLPAQETGISDQMKQLTLDDTPPSCKQLEGTPEATETRSVSITRILFHEDIAMASTKAIDSENRKLEKAGEDRDEHSSKKEKTEQRKEIDDDSDLTELAALTGQLGDKEVTVLTKKLISPKSNSRHTGSLRSSSIAPTFQLSTDPEVVPPPLSQTSSEGNLETVEESESPMGACAVHIVQCFERNVESLTKCPSSQSTSEGTESTIPSEEPSSEEGGNSEDQGLWEKRTDSTEIAVLTRRLCDKEVAMLTRRPLSPQLMLRSTGTPRASVVIAQRFEPSPESIAVTSSSSCTSSDDCTEAQQQLTSAIHTVHCPESDVESSAKFQSILERTDAAIASEEQSSEEGGNGEEPGLSDVRTTSTDIAVLTGRLCDKEVAMFTRRSLSPQLFLRDTGTPRVSVVASRGCHLSPEPLPIPPPTTEPFSDEQMEVVQESACTNEEFITSSVHVVQFSDGEGESIKYLSPPQSAPEGTETTRTFEAHSSETESVQYLETSEARTVSSEIAVLTGPLCDKEVAMLTKRRLTPQLFTRATGTPRANVVAAQRFHLYSEPVAVPPPISRMLSDDNAEAIQQSANVRDVSRAHNIPFSEGPVECSTKWPSLLHSTPEETETSTDGDTCEASSEGSNEQELSEKKSVTTDRADRTLHIDHTQIRNLSHSSLTQHSIQEGTHTSTTSVTAHGSPVHESVAFQPPTSHTTSETGNVSIGEVDEELSLVREIIAEHFPYCYEEEDHILRCRAPLYSIPEEAESRSEEEPQNTNTSSEEARTDSSDEEAGTHFVYYDNYCTTSPRRSPAPLLPQRGVEARSDSGDISEAFSPEEATAVQSSIPQAPTSVGSETAQCETEMYEELGMNKDSVVWSSLLSLLSAQPSTPEEESKGAVRGMGATCRVAGPGMLSHEDVTSRLLEAAWVGDLEGVLRALMAGADVDEPRASGWGALVGFAEADQPFGLGWHALQVAARGGHTSVVTLLVQSGADVNLADVHGRTALHEAASFNHVACVVVLLRAGASVDQPDEQCSLTPLHLAALHGSEGAAHALLAAGADTAALDLLGRTPLLLARCEAMRRLLLVWHALRQPPWLGHLAQTHGAQQGLHAPSTEHEQSFPHALHAHNTQHSINISHAQQDRNVLYAQQSHNVRHAHQAPNVHTTTNRPRGGRRQRGGNVRQRRHSI